MTKPISGKPSAVIPKPVPNPTGYLGAWVVMKMLLDTKFAQFPKPSWIAVPNDLEARPRRFAVKRPIYIGIVMNVPKEMRN